MMAWKEIKGESLFVRTGRKRTPRCDVGVNLLSRVDDTRDDEPEMLSRWGRDQHSCHANVSAAQQFSPL